MVIPSEDVIHVGGDRLASSETHRAPVIVSPENLAPETNPVLRQPFSTVATAPYHRYLPSEVALVYPYRASASGACDKGLLRRPVTV